MVFCLSYPRIKINPIEMTTSDISEERSRKENHLGKKQQRKILYIRHGEDKRKGYKYDESLTRRGKRDVKEWTEELLDTYGTPDAIYFSPFYRTRQTKKIMLSVIKNLTNEWVKEVECDLRLSRYFTKSQKRNPDIKRSTEKYSPPIDETWKEFHQRIRDQLKDMESSPYRLIWCVTHTLVLDHIIERKGIPHEYHIPYLDTLVISA